MRARRGVRVISAWKFKFKGLNPSTSAPCKTIRARRVGAYSPGALQNLAPLPAQFIPVQSNPMRTTFADIPICKMGARLTQGRRKLAAHLRDKLGVFKD